MSCDTVYGTDFLFNPSQVMKLNQKIITEQVSQTEGFQMWGVTVIECDNFAITLILPTDSTHRRICSTWTFAIYNLAFMHSFFGNHIRSFILLLNGIHHHCGCDKWLFHFMASEFASLKRRQGLLNQCLNYIWPILQFQNGCDQLWVVQGQMCSVKWMCK